MAITDKKVLIIDDDSTIRTLLARVIESAGCVPIDADGVPAALTLIHKHHPDVIILDLNMPGHDGFSFLQARKKMALLSPIPVIVLSGKRDKKTIAKAMALGADHYLEKPFEARRILQTLRFVFHSREGLNKQFEADQAPAVNCRVAGQLLARGKTTVQIESPIRLCKQRPVALSKEGLVCKVVSSLIEFHEGQYQQQLQIIATSGKEPESAPAKAPEPVATTPETAPLILSIDDDPAINLFLEAQLQSFGCRVKTFTDPKEFETAVATLSPALVIIDLNLGEGLSGFDLIQQIRDQLHLSVPILISTGDRKESSFVHALELGANDYLTKSLNLDDLKKRVQDLLPAADSKDGAKTQLDAVPDAQRATHLDFRMKILEISSGGAKLLTHHLIRKGTTMLLYGEAIKSILPDRGQVEVSVVTVANFLHAGERVFLQSVQFDTSDEVLIQNIQSWIAKQA